MRTCIDIEATLIASALKAGPFKSKKGAVEADLKLPAYRVAYREDLKWGGKLTWEGDESVDWTASPPGQGSAPTTRAETRSARVELPSASDRVKRA